MIDKEYINEVSDLILDIIGVGPFVLIYSVNRYIRRKELEKIKSIMLNYDLYEDIDDLIDLAIEDLTEQKIIIKHGASIQRPHTTRNINHRNN